MGSEAEVVVGSSGGVKLLVMSPQAWSQVVRMVSAEPSLQQRHAGKARGGFEGRGEAEKGGAQAHEMKIQAQQMATFSVSKANVPHDLWLACLVFVGVLVRRGAARGVPARTKHIEICLLIYIYIEVVCRKHTTCLY